jgi:hypothetical protein
LPDASAAQEPAQQPVREFVRDCVRSGLLDGEELRAECVAAVRAELPGLDADTVARSWIAEFREELRRDQDAWPEVTDFDRLQEAFADLRGRGVIVLQGCEDHWAAKSALDQHAGAHGGPARGIAWFTPPDVWHAIDAGMLEVNLWHGNTANAAPGDALLDEVVGVFEAHGLPAHFDEGRIEVSAYWQRRLA